MKGIDIFCASQASTSIRLSMDEASSSSSSSSLSSSTIHLGNSRAIDRHNPIIRDAKRIGKSFNPPCSAQSPINPIPYHQQIQQTHQKNRKKTSSKMKDQTKKKKSSNPVVDLKKKSVFAKPIENSSSFVKKSSVKNGGGDLISPPGSTRYLLGDENHTAFVDVLSDFDPVLKLVPVDLEPTNNQSHHAHIEKKPDESSASKSSASPDQVVVLRVSLHCKGCEGKVRKHISRMKGVRSFNIDFAAKKVTVIGDVTPLEVLASVSKIKSAQLWTPPTPPPPPPISSSSLPSCGGFTNSELKKHENNYANSTQVV